MQHLDLNLNIVSWEKKALSRLLYCRITLEEKERKTKSERKKEGKKEAAGLNRHLSAALPILTICWWRKVPVSQTWTKNTLPSPPLWKSLQPAFKKKKNNKKKQHNFTMFCFFQSMRSSGNHMLISHPPLYSPCFWHICIRWEYEHVLLHPAELLSLSQAQLAEQ